MDNNYEVLINKYMNYLSYFFRNVDHNLNNFNIQRDMVCDQIDDFLVACKTFNDKREEYIKLYGAECESINRMYFKKLEKPFDIYSKIISGNINSLYDSFEFLLNNSLRLGENIKSILKIYNYMNDNKLLKLKEMNGIAVALSKYVLSYILIDNMFTTINKEMEYINDNYDFAIKFYKDDKIFDDFYK